MARITRKQSTEALIFFIVLIVLIALLGAFGKDLLRQFVPEAFRAKISD